MKKILLFLLLSIAGYGQTTTGQEQEFDYGIKNNSTQTVTNPNTLVTQGADGTYGKASVNNIPISIPVQDSLNKKLNLPTGFLQGLQLSINVDPTKYNIAAGYYVVTDFTNLAQPVVKIITYAGATGLTPTYLATANSTYVALDINGSVVSSASPFTDAQRRTLAIVGNVVHSNNTTINVTNEIKAPIVAIGNQVHDFMKAVGFLNENGNIYSANGANLMLNKSSGDIFGMGINSADYLNPHKLTIPSQTALTFAYRFQNGTQLADTQNINPNIYDVGGVSTAVPVGSRWTVQRINLFQSGLARIQPGQTVYTSFNDAVIGLPTQAFVTEQNIADNAVFRCYLIVQQGTTNLASAVAGGTAQFVPVDKFGNVIGNGSVALTYNNIIAALGYTPENVANKQNSLAVDGTGVKYATVDAVNTLKRIKSNESLTLAQRKGDVLYGILDQYTGEEITLSKVTGTPTVDGVIYFQLGAEYFKRDFTFVRPEWFGLDGVNDQIAINKSLSVNRNTDNAKSSGNVVKLTGGKTYVTSAPIRFGRYEILEGNGSFINSTSTTNIIEGVTELFTNNYRSENVTISDVILKGTVAVIGMDLKGFTYSKFNNVKVFLYNTSGNEIGISLNHGSLGYEQCYFNEINNCFIYLAGFGTGIAIKGVDGVSGANSNRINGGVISGSDKYGLTIDNNSYENIINGLDFEHVGVVSTTIAVYLIKGNLNSIYNSNIENYEQGIKITSTSNSNVMSNNSLTNNTINNQDLSINNTWISGSNISIGDVNLTDNYTKLRVSATNFPAIRIDSKYPDSSSRNWAFRADFGGNEFDFMRSSSQGSDPLSGTSMWRINSSGNFVLPLYPPISSGSFDILTRNTSTGVFEYKLSNYYQTALTNPVTGSGTIHYIPKFTNATGLANSVISQANDGGGEYPKIINEGGGVPGLKLIGNRSGFNQTINILGGTSISDSQSMSIGQTDGGVAYINNRSNTDFLIYLNGIQKLSLTPSGILNIPSLTLLTTPTTSASTYDFVTRNTSSGVFEKVLSNTIATVTSPSFTGTPTAPTATVGTNTTQIATTAFGFANFVSLTGNQVIDGSKTFNNIVSSIGALIDNGGSNTGVAVINNGNATGISINSDSTGKALVLNNDTGATGTPLTISKNNVDKFTVTDGGVVTVGVYTVATLPTPTGTAYATVSDALAPSYMVTVVGGGAVVTPVFYNGVNWVAH